MIRPKALKALATTKFRSKPYFPTVSDVHLWTAIINHLLFEGEVPRYRKVTIKRLCSVYARCIGHTGKKGQHYCSLEIHSRFPSFTSFYSILLHELIHVREWTHKEHGGKTMTHGDFFLSHEQLAAMVGVSLRESYRPQLESPSN